MKISIDGVPLRTGDDGSATFATDNGAAYAVDRDGNVSIDLQRIAAVGVHNVMDVEHYAINTVMGSISHYLRFFGGGEVRFSYNDRGELIELSATNVDVSVTQQNELTFRRTRGGKK